MSTTTSVSVGSIKILGRRRKEKAVLEKGVMLGRGGDPDVYLQEREQNNWVFDPRRSAGSCPCGESL